MEHTILVAENLTKIYRSKYQRELKAVDNLSFTVKEGEIVGFLGPNGSGKSTTVKMITGLASPTSGTVKVMGYSVLTESKKALRYVGGVIESPDLYLSMTGLQNLRYFASLYPGDILAEAAGVANTPEVLKKAVKERVDQLLMTVGLYERKDDPVKKYSLGMKQRLGIAQALIGKPKLLILDEPANGLDPAAIKGTRDLLKDLAAQGMGILVSSHLLAEMQLLCDRVIILSAGKKIAEKNISELYAGEDGSMAYSITVDKPEEAAAFLSEKFNIAAKRENNTLHIQSSADASQLTRELILAGFNISAFKQEERRLEDVFMQATDRRDFNV